jgi:hypothetical protein
MKSARFSLFFVQKRAFKVFNKETKQDTYSTKRLLDKSFFVVSSPKHINEVSSYSPYFGHFFFCVDIFPSYPLLSLLENYSFCICIHCGMNFY